MKTRVVLNCMLLAAMVAAQEPVVSNTVSETDEVVDRIAKLLGTGNDPFRFGYQRGAPADKNLIPIDASQLAVGTVTVKGILNLEGQLSCALVQVGGNTQLQLVREQDLILMPNDSRGFGLKKQAAESKYLLVNKILKDSILVSPKKSPETTITIR